MASFFFLYFEGIYILLIAFLFVSVFLLVGGFKFVQNIKSVPRIEMEALLSFDENQNIYYNVGGKLRASKGFRGFICRTFQTGAAVFLQSPSSRPRLFSVYSEPRYPCIFSELPKQSDKSKPIPIDRSCSSKVAIVSDEFSCPELWAGPAHSKSPPPSSLPIPKFYLGQKRSISLGLPFTEPDDVLHPVSKSAPSSPTRGLNISDINFLINNAKATENLRRLLHMDVSND